MRRAALAAALVVALLIGAVPPAPPAIAAPAPTTALRVTPDGPYTTIQRALEDAVPGDTIVVDGGVYPNLVIDKSVEVVGVNGARIDGGGSGDVVLITAPDVTLRGFEIRYSGRSLDQENAGVTVTAPRALVEQNVMRDVLFGVYLKDAARSIVRNNDIIGYDLYVARRGDGLRAWYSEGVQFIENRVQRGRDVILWFSDDAVVRGNVISDGRYGLHFMYDDRMVVQDNRVMRNSVGMFLMYSSNVAVLGNELSDNFGPSGYGLGLKEVANLRVADNVMMRNRIGISLDSTPHGVDAYADFTSNLVALNDVGMAFLPSVERARMVGNSFDGNATQVEVRGGGDLEGNVWNEQQGNYWSDYVGYDADGDHVGDVPYEPRSLFESLRDKHPELSFFNHSPAADAVDFAARAIPNLQPGRKIVDEAPLVDAHVPAWFSQEDGSAWPWYAAGAGLSMAALALVGVVVAAPALGTLRRPRTAPASELAVPAVEASGLGKRYGRLPVLADFDLSVAPGEAVALWGPNGAGKTTALRCILGLIAHQGAVRVNGVDTRADPKRARAFMGYVPQDQQLPDLPVRDLVAFFGGLRGVAPADALQVARDLDLDPHMEKRPDELSGGLRQRLALALASLGSPRLLLLDEPTANLDVATRGTITALLEEMHQRGAALLFTTHRLEEVISLADRVVTLDGGRIVAVQSVEAFAAAADTSSTIMIRVPADAVARAEAVLTAAGFDVSSRADWLSASGCGPHEPLEALWRAEIVVLETVLARQQ